MTTTPKMSKKPKKAKWRIGFMVSMLLAISLVSSPRMVGVFFSVIVACYCLFQMVVVDEGWYDRQPNNKERGQ